MHLFNQKDLDTELRARREGAAQAVDEIQKEQFLISEDQDIVDHVVSGSSVEPLVLHEGEKTMEQSETQVDVSRDPNRFPPLRPTEPFYVSGIRIDVRIPFSGDEWVFQYRTNPRPMEPLHGELDQGSLLLSVSFADDVEPERFKRAHHQKLELLKRFVTYSRSQVQSHNQALPGFVHSVVAMRRKRLRKQAHIAELLAIPLASKPDAPALAPVRIAIRQPPKLPVPPKTGLTPEPGIEHSAYEKVLQCLRHQGRTFEKAPSTFAKHGEEDLRNFILAHLNGHFEGDAIGEAFRKRGKTDICIERDDRAAFVGECKLWAGPASLTKALDQLLGYLTWRDSKATLIIFNSKNRNFSRIIAGLAGALRGHRLFLRDLACEELGEWRVEMRSEEDEGRRVTVHVFLFDLYERQVKNRGR